MALKPRSVSIACAKSKKFSNSLRTLTRRPKPGPCTCTALYIFYMKTLLHDIQSSKHDLQWQQFKCFGEASGRVINFSNIGRSKLCLTSQDRYAGFAAGALFSVRLKSACTPSMDLSHTLTLTEESESCSSTTAAGHC